MSKIISLTGFIGSGKDTVADHLINKNFEQFSFSSSLKDTLSIIFQWDREMLEGKTKESRKWRDEVDNWWADRLDIPELTPRFMLRYFGTEVCRNNLHEDIWVANVEKRIESSTTNIVISDCRYPNEFNIIKKCNGILIHVKNDEYPDWYHIALAANKGDIQAKLYLDNKDIHSSEYSWIGTKFDYIIENTGTIKELYKKVDKIIQVL